MLDLSLGDCVSVSLPYETGENAANEDGETRTLGEGSAKKNILAEFII